MLVFWPSRGLSHDSVFNACTGTRARLTLVTLRTNILKVSQGSRTRTANRAGEGDRYPVVAAALAAIGRRFYSRGWTLGTSGNFSTVVSRRPLCIAITRSGVNKGRLTAQQIVQVDTHGRALRGTGRPSDETRLHLTLVRSVHAEAVLHTHSIWSTIASDVHAREGGVCMEGYEMLKGLHGVRTHEHREWLPIIENSQDMVALSTNVRHTLEKHRGAHGFLLRGHGLYTWGRGLDEAERHTEILEFLLEVIGRREGCGLAVRKRQHSRNRPN